MAYTKSASKLQNFPDIAISFGGKFAYKPHFSFLFSIFNHFSSISPCLIREKVVTFRMVKLNLLLSIFCITKWVTHF